MRTPCAGGASLPPTRPSRPRLASLLVDKEFATALAQREAAWRRVVALGVTTGVAMPGMSASLAYFDTYRCARLPAPSPARSPSRPLSPCLRRERSQSSAVF